MTVGDQLIAAVIADPDDDTVRLAYADWCEENDDELHAELIRLSLPPLNEPTSGNRDNYRRRKRLSVEYRKRLKREFELGRWWQYNTGFPRCRRGFCEEVRLTDDCLGVVGEAILRSQPIRTVVVRLASGVDREVWEAKYPRVKFEWNYEPLWNEAVRTTNNTVTSSLIQAVTAIMREVPRPSTGDLRFLLSRSDAESLRQEHERPGPGTYEVVERFADISVYVSETIDPGDAIVVTADGRVRRALSDEIPIGVALSSSEPRV